MTRVRRAGGIGVDTAYARAIAKLERSLDHREQQGIEAAATFHMEAPRGGQNINDFGDRRSAWGEAPAIEYGTLLDLILNHRIRSPLFRAFIVNYLELEWLLNRPLGQFTLDELKSLVAARR